MCTCEGRDSGLKEGEKAFALLIVLKGFSRVLFFLTSCKSVLNQLKTIATVLQLSRAAFLYLNTQESPFACEEPGTTNLWLLESDGSWYKSTPGSGSLYSEMVMRTQEKKMVHS